MYCQLGTTIFDGAKSFVSFTEDGEAIVVQHAIINRPARLQGTAEGPRTLSISIFFHQEFCDVKTEVAKIKSSKKNFEILPLLWGNGQVEGEFVITQINKTNTQMDALGNVYAAAVNLTLLEVIEDDKLTKQQEDAKNNAFAVGDKKPAVKSSRINAKTCSKQVASIISIIKSNSHIIDGYSRIYTGQSLDTARIVSCCDVVMTNAQKLVDASKTPGSCVNTISGFYSASLNVKAKAQFVKESANGGNVAQEKIDNNNLQAGVRLLVSVASPVIKSSVTRK